MVRRPILRGEERAVADVLVQNTTRIKQLHGIYVIEPGGTARVPLEIAAGWPDVAVVAELDTAKSIAFYRGISRGHGDTLCKPACGHSLCLLTEGLSRALRTLGVRVDRFPWRATDQAQTGQSYLCNSATFEGPAGRFAWPHPDADMFPASHIALLRAWDGIICGSQAIRDALVRSGIAPERCHVVNHCIDTDLYRPEGPVADLAGNRFVFLSLGAQNPRKGFDLALEAYGKAFDRDDPVTLVLKDYDYGWGRKGWCQEQVAAWRKRLGDKAPELTYVYDTWEPAQIAATYRRAAQHGAYIMPSRCEGFGLTGLEALACGCRLGTTGWSGQLDYTTPENATLFGYTLSRNEANPHWWGPGEEPHWADANVDEIVVWMRRMVEEPRREAHQVAEANGLRQRFSYARMARGFAGVLGLDVGVEVLSNDDGHPRPAAVTSSPAVPPPSPITADETLGVGIPTRDRPGYLAALLGALLCQTRLPQAVCIVDDGGGLAQNPAIAHLVALMKHRGIRAEVVAGSGKGASQNHEIARRWLGTDLVLRIDDDVLPATADFSERLYRLINRAADVGAVGGSYPEWNAQELDYAAHRGKRGMDNRIAEMLVGAAPLQMRWWRGAGEVVECEHLYSTWMYRSRYLEEAHLPGEPGGFADCYSRFGQREESDASIRLHLLGGHRLLVDTGAVGWHFVAGGGRRPEGTKAAWDHDEQVFRGRLARWQAAQQGGSD